MFPKLVTLFAVLLIGVVGDELVVRTAQGLVRGHLSELGSYYQFRGIPYAGNITGENRYKNPTEPPTWDGVFDASRTDVYCPQNGADGVRGSDDCLVLNVFAPLAARRLPVLAFIHGGSFQGGSSAAFGPRHLAEHGVIFVTLNYRSGILGFLCLGRELAPGNAGQKDQVAALLWIRRNIAQFGGDPDNVTVMGHSSGAASVDHLTLSPHAAGLFRRAIVESGSAVAGWGVNIDPITRAQTIARLSGYETNNIDGLLDYFINTDISILLRGMSAYAGTLLDSSLPTAPCVEQRLPGVEPFLTRLPIDIIRSRGYKSVPLLTGVSSMETTMMFSLSPEGYLSFEDSLVEYLPVDLEFEDDAERDVVLERIRQFYFTGSTDVNTISEQYARYRSDITFYVPQMRTAEERLKVNSDPVYFYEFRFEGGLSGVKDSAHQHVVGAVHGDIDGYLILESLAATNDRDQRMIDRLSLMWTNFAKYGNPTPEPNELVGATWYPATEKKFQYLVIDEEFTPETDPNAAAIEFWRDIYARYGRFNQEPSI